MHINKYYVIHSQIDSLMDLSPPQIAIMDDDEDTVNLFTDIINMQGYLVIGFTNPYSLIDYISENPEQLKFIIIDYRMPQMTGCKLASQINKINPNIKMAFVSGYDNIINNTLNIEIFKKPLTVPQIIELVNKNMNY